MGNGNHQASCLLLYLLSHGKSDSTNMQDGDTNKKSQGLEFIESSQWARYRSEGFPCINSLQAPL